MCVIYFFQLTCSVYLYYKRARPNPSGNSSPRKEELLVEYHLVFVSVFPFPLLLLLLPLIPDNLSLPRSR